MKKLSMPAISIAALAQACPAHVIGSPRAEAAPTDETWREVSQKLDQLNGNIKQTAENALSEAKRAGEVSQETKTIADRLLNEQSALQKTLEGVQNALEGLDSKILETAQNAARGGTGGNPAAQSLGRQVANDDRVKSYEGGILTLTVSNTVTTATGSAGGLISHPEEREPVRIPRRRLLVRNLLAQGSTSSDSVHTRKQTLRDSGAAGVAEGAPSAASNFGWEKAVERVKKIATHTNVSEEALADADQLASELDGELRYLLDLEEEMQIVAGDGAGENLRGLLMDAPEFVAPGGLPNANRIDRLRLGLMLVTLEGYMPAEILLNPLDWAGIELMKVGGSGGGDDRYVFGNPNTSATPVLWGKSVVETLSMSAGEWLAGDLAMAATYYDRAQTEVIMSTEHDTNFIEDMVTVKARRRAAQVNKRPAAMVQGDFTFV
ncbi:phage major capsid protein [Sagittula sp. NFXS13]|uniref:phage major capsid protein n=1 Tax=Sagittula sp. NFXS13 TaxID=2819095 RepID=UPI0032DFD568